MVVWPVLVVLTLVGAALQSVGSGLTPAVDVVDLVGLRVVDVAAGDGWRVASAPFVSSFGWPHALLNVAGIALVGRAVERSAGGGRAAVAAVFGSGCLAAFAAGAHAHGTVWLAAGSSGGVLACAGWLLARRVAGGAGGSGVRAAVLVVAATFVAPLVLGWWFDVFRRGSTAAHLGGLAAGLVVGLAGSAGRRAAVTTAVVVVAVSVAAVVPLVPGFGERPAVVRACPPEAPPQRSDAARAGDRTRLTFVNETGEPVRVYWVTYRGVRAYSTTIGAERSLWRNRVPFYGHDGASYLVTDRRGRCLVAVVAGRSASVVRVSRPLLLARLE